MKFVFKALFALICLVLVVLFGIKRSPKGDVLVLGTMSGWPPYVNINDAGVYEGLDIDIAQEIARRLNKKLEIEDMDTAALLMAVMTGKVDFIMTGLGITPARLKKINMIPYQGEKTTEIPLIFWKTIPQGIETLSDIEKRPEMIVCVEAGSVQEGIIEGYPGITIRNCDPQAAVLELKYDKATALLLEKDLYKELKKRFPELVALTITLKPEEQLQGNGIGIAKNNEMLQKEITAIVTQLSEEGFIASREAYWMNKVVS